MRKLLPVSESEVVSDATSLQHHSIPFGSLSFEIFYSIYVPIACG